MTYEICATKHNDLDRLKAFKFLRFHNLMDFCRYYLLSILHISQQAGK